MELQRLGVKFFAADPASIRLEDIIPIFHGWIQQQAVAGHLLIDVHDYSHIQGGPGILLVAHEGNFSVDMSEGRPGLFYYRKIQTALPPIEHMSAIVKSALDACHRLEKETKVRFKMDEIVVIANDRLSAPNDDAAFAELKPVVAAALENAIPGSAFNLTRISSNPKDRLTITCRRGL